VTSFARGFSGRHDFAALVELLWWAKNPRTLPAFRGLGFGVARASPATKITAKNVRDFMMFQGGTNQKVERERRKLDGMESFPVDEFISEGLRPRRRGL